MRALLRPMRSARQERWRRRRGAGPERAELQERLARMRRPGLAGPVEAGDDSSKGWVPAVDLDSLLEDLRRRARPPSAGTGARTGAGPQAADEPAQPAGAVAAGAMEVGAVAAGRRRRWSAPRWDPGRRGASALAVAAGLAAILTAVWVMVDLPLGAVSHVDPVSATTGPAASLAAPVPAPPGAAPGVGGSSGASPTAPAGSGSSPPAVVVVDVAGLVAAPGVYSLPAGARVADALAAAGGALPGIDLSALNLARVVVDGEQIPVGVEGAGHPPSAGGLTAAGDPSGAVVDLNSAGAQELDQLPGVGPVLAQNILHWRDEHGRFDSIDQLRDVSGIGEAKFAQLKGRVRV